MSKAKTHSHSHSRSHQKKAADSKPEIDLDDEELDALDSIQEEGDAPIAAAAPAAKPKPALTPQDYQNARLRKARMARPGRRR